MILRAKRTGANNVGDHGAEKIATALNRSTCYLTFLSLSRNAIGDAGAKSLAGTVVVSV